jgi:hypothetical protein
MKQTRAKVQDPTQKIKITKSVDVAQVVENLANKHRVLSSILSTV